MAKWYGDQSVMMMTMWSDQTAKMVTMNQLTDKKMLMLLMAMMMATAWSYDCYMGYWSVVDYEDGDEDEDEGEGEDEDEDDGGGGGGGDGDGDDNDGDVI